MYADFDPKTQHVSIHNITVDEAKRLKRYLQKDRNLPANQLDNLTAVDTLIAQLNQVLTTVALQQ